MNLRNLNISFNKIDDYMILCDIIKYNRHLESFNCESNPLVGYSFLDSFIFR